jgi:hypothetical protein
MSKIIYIILFFIMVISLLANPAPVDIELADFILIVLPIFLCGFTLHTIPNYRMSSTEIDLFLAIIFYLMYLFISMLVGVLNGIAVLTVLRSVGPYINFVPLLFIALLSDRIIKPSYVGVILILVGIFQAFYLFFLYFSHSSDAENTLSILINRITLLDPHTTLPLIFSLIILPLVFMSYQNQWIKLLATGLFIFGVIAGSATLTRSIIIASVMGAITFILLYAYQSSKLLKIHFLYRLLKIFSKLFYFIPVYLLLLMIPQIYHLEQGLIARFLNHSSAGTSDYSNGRLFDEWLPALTTWANSGLMGWLFGIGAGNTFTVTSGEERTYIHNLSIYSLVYGGFFGLFSCMWLYLTVFKTLIIRAYQTHQTIYLGFAALLTSIFVYGQFFAVHKGLAFNAMLFMIIVIALTQPVNHLMERRI